jgi:DNA-directed RNA polymerase alpha subunit
MTTKRPNSTWYPVAWRREPVHHDADAHAQTLNLSLRAELARMLAGNAPDCELSVRAMNLLHDATRIQPVNTVGDLARLRPEELMQWKNMGRRTVREIDDWLRTQHGLSLGMVTSS